MAKRNYGKELDSVKEDLNKMLDIVITVVGRQGSQMKMLSDAMVVFKEFAEAVQQRINELEAKLDGTITGGNDED